MPRAQTAWRSKRQAADERRKLAMARQGVRLVTEDNAARLLKAVQKRERLNNRCEPDWLSAPAWARLAFTTAKRNAAKRGIPFKITRTDMEIIVVRCRGLCEISGLPFELEAHATACRRPFAPSLDRIDSSKGYVRENIRIICVIANLALNQWGDETLLTLARALVAKSQGAE